MADLRVDSPRLSEDYVAAFARLGIRLPLDHAVDDAGEVVDDLGKSVFTVDVNHELADQVVEEIAALIILAVNTCGGFRAVAAEDPEGDPAR